MVRTKKEKPDPICEACRERMKGTVPAHACEWCKEEQQKKGRRAWVADIKLGSVLLGDMNEIGQRVPADSVDVIFTDPPYIKELYEQAYADLAELAHRVLKPHGFLFTYAPQTHLDEIMDLLRYTINDCGPKANLRYFWVIESLNGGQSTAKNHQRNAICLHKPILVFQKAREDVQLKGARRCFADVVRGLRQKKFHPWQQSVHDVLGIISRFMVPGEILLDPYAGTGTSLIAGQLLGMEVVGFEIDPNTHAIAVREMQQKPLGLIDEDLSPDAEREPAPELKETSRQAAIEDPAKEARPVELKAACLRCKVRETCTTHAPYVNCKKIEAGKADTSKQLPEAIPPSNEAKEGPTPQDLLDAALFTKENDAHLQIMRQDPDHGPQPIGQVCRECKGFEQCTSHDPHAGCLDAVKVTKKPAGGKKADKFDACVSCKVWAKCQGIRPATPECQAFRKTEEDLKKFSEECPSDGKNPVVCADCIAEQFCAKYKAWKESKPDLCGGCSFLHCEVFDPDSPDCKFLHPTDGRVLGKPAAEQSPAPSGGPTPGTCGTCGHHKGRKTFNETCPRLGELLFKGGTKSAKVLMEETQRDRCKSWILKGEEPAKKRKKEPALEECTEKCDYSKRCRYRFPTEDCKEVIGAELRSTKGTPEWFAALTEAKRRNNPGWLWEVWKIVPKKGEWLYEGARTEEFAEEIQHQLEKTVLPYSGVIFRVIPRPPPDYAPDDIEGPCKVCKIECLDDNNGCQEFEEHSRKLDGEGEQEQYATWPVCIISCGKAKIWDNPGKKKVKPLVYAEDAYTGPLFTAAKNYAEKHNGPWYILSDKYGLILPGEEIGNYDISPEDIKNDPDFFDMVHHRARTDPDLSRTKKIILLSGKIHQDIIERAFPGVEIENPVQGLTQGERMKALKALVETTEEKTPAITSAEDPKRCDTPTKTTLKCRWHATCDRVGKPSDSCWQDMAREFAAACKWEPEISRCRECDAFGFCPKIHHPPEEKEKIPNISWCSTIRDCPSLDWEGGICTKTGKKIKDQTYCPTQHLVGKPKKPKATAKDPSCQACKVFDDCKTKNKPRPGCSQEVGQKKPAKKPVKKPKPYTIYIKRSDGEHPLMVSCDAQGHGGASYPCDTREDVIKRALVTIDEFVHNAKKSTLQKKPLPVTIETTLFIDKTGSFNITDFFDENGEPKKPEPKKPARVKKSKKKEEPES